MTNIEFIFEALQSDWPTERPSDTLPSRVASVDAKLCYNQSEDEFYAFLLGDINANPGGIQDRTNKSKRDIETIVSDAFLSNIKGSDLQIAIVLPEDVYDDRASQWLSPKSWYTRDRQTIVRAIRGHRRVSSVIEVTDRSHLRNMSGVLSVTGEDETRPVSGYVNLDDTDCGLFRALNGDVAMLSKGANAPTAIWNPQFDETGKVSLLRTATDRVTNVPNVCVPRFARVESLKELERFRDEVGDIILKSPFGTHGNEVIPIREDESPLQRIRAAEARIRNAIEHPSFKIYNETNNEFVFNARGWESGYGVVEEVIAGSLNRGEHSFEVLELNKADNTYPIDFVPLTVCRGGRQSETPSIMVRISTIDNLNANLHSKSMALEALPVAFEEGIDVHLNEKVPRAIEIQQEAERIAQRPVSIEELRYPLQQAGRLALLVRNQTALQIEQTLLRDK